MWSRQLQTSGKPISKLSQNNVNFIQLNSSPSPYLRNPKQNSTKCLSIQNPEDKPPLMAAGSSQTITLFVNSFLRLKPSHIETPTLVFSPSLKQIGKALRARRLKPRLSVCFILEDEKFKAELVTSADETATDEKEVEKQIAAVRLAQKVAKKRSERFTYLVAAVMSSFGITSMAVMAVYYRFAWQMEGGEVPLTEMFGTFALSVGAAVGMEFWARWAHKALWHASLWHMHESHHRPREGAFELNDIFAITNAVPAIALLSYGFLNKGLVPGLCFGAGLGITVFGMAYMFVHDGLVHKRFPVGPIANVPYFRRVAAAHQLHHSDKFNGVPYGLFLGPMELEKVGGLEELEKEVNRKTIISNRSS